MQYIYIDEIYKPCWNQKCKILYVVAIQMYKKHFCEQQWFLLGIKQFSEICILGGDKQLDPEKALSLKG